jgi:hypothetical protein
MIALKVARDTSTPRARAPRYCIRLNIPPTAREDTWELCRLAARYGGVEAQDCLFAFPSEERQLSALEALGFRFGLAYFETVESIETDPDCE